VITDLTSPLREAPAGDKSLSQVYSTSEAGTAGAGSPTGVHKIAPPFLSNLRFGLVAPPEASPLSTHCAGSVSISGAA